jgi:hypothetical protein
MLPHFRHCALVARVDLVPNCRLLAKITGCMKPLPHMAHSARAPSSTAIVRPSSMRTRIMECLSETRCAAGERSDWRNHGRCPLGRGGHMVVEAMTRHTASDRVRPTPVSRHRTSNSRQCRGILSAKPVKGRASASDSLHGIPDDGYRAQHCIKERGS